MKSLPTCLLAFCVLQSLTDNQCHAGKVRWSLFSSWKRSKQEPATSASSPRRIESLSLPSATSINRKDKCKCDCEEDDDHESDGVQLMAMEKVIKVPKIKIHDFGKKEDWELVGKIDNMDMTNPYAKGRKQKFVMRTQSMSEPESESAWEVAGKYNFEEGNWDFDGKPGFSF